MCDEVNRDEKSEARVAAQVATQVAAAATATPQGTAAATAKPQVTAQLAAHKAATHKDADSKKTQVVDREFARAENEDDDGYDPYSDRRPVSEPLFERDPWS
jgi:hypothetical protein